MIAIVINNNTANGQNIITLTHSPDLCDKEHLNNSAIIIPINIYIAININCTMIIYNKSFEMFNVFFKKFYSNLLYCFNLSCPFRVSM